MQDQHAEEDVGVAAHEADPAGLAVEDHQDGQVDNGGCQRGAAADEAAEGHAFEGGIRVVLVGVESAEGDNE